MKIKQILTLAILFVASGVCQAQDIKYVSYFPVPFALHEQLDIKTLSILGSRGGAQISAGSDSNITSVFTVSDSFSAADNVYILSHQNSSPSVSDAPVNMTVGLASATGSTPHYDSSVGAMGNIQITSFSGGSVAALEAYNNAVVAGIKWGSNGGIGLNGSGNVNWPSQCSGFNLSWVDLKLQGSDHYATYLTCGGSSGTSGGGCTCSGGVAPGNYQACGGGRQRLCGSDCSWGACACPNPLVWNGTQCVSGGSSVTPIQVTTTSVVSPSSSGGSSCGSSSYTLCQPGTGSWIDSGQINPDGCSQRTTYSVCYNDYIASGDQQKYVCTELSMPNCSGTNYQSICNTNGKGYKCKISASGSYNSAWICMCAWENNRCGEASGLSCENLCLDGEGTGKYLSCE